MQWTLIVPRKARPNCQQCQRRARWSCVSCMNIERNQASRCFYRPGLTVCDGHREYAELLETRWLLQAVISADQQTREGIGYYLCSGGFPVVAAFRKILDAKNSAYLVPILYVCLLGGDEYARQLAYQPPKGKSTPVYGLIRGLLRNRSRATKPCAGRTISSRHVRQTRSSRLIKGFTTMCEDCEGAASRSS